MSVSKKKPLSQLIENQSIYKTKIQPREYIEIDWEKPWPPLYGKTITIPENTILWRSYETSYPAVGDRFAYYSSKLVASGYKTSTRELGCFIATRTLKVLDIRFMKPLLSRLIQMNSSDKSLNEFLSLIISFGLCSLRHQIELVKQKYNQLYIAIKNDDNSKYIKKAIKQLENYYNPQLLIEQSGLRIAETSNDIITMGFLQELFKGVFDGFISPRLYSPFHVEKENNMMSPELIIFNPLESNIQQIDYNLITSPIKTIIIHELIYKHDKHIILENIKKEGIDIGIKLNFYMTGGNPKKNKKHYLDEADELLNENNIKMVELFNKGKEDGKYWKKKVNIYELESPVPTLQITPFLKSMYFEK